MIQKFHFEGLKPGQTYKFQVVATSADGSVKSAPSNIVSFTASGDYIAPSQPTSLITDFNNTTMTASWVGPDITDTPDFLDYKIVITNPSFSASQTFYTSNKSFNFPIDLNRALFGLTTPSPSITIAVSSRDTSGNLSSATTGTSVNPVPSSLTSASPDFSGKDLYIKWTPISASTDNDATGYQLKLSNAAAAKTITYPIVGKDAISFTLPFEQNSRDFGGVPRPTFNASLTAIDIFGQLSATPYTATITNPPPTESPSITNAAGIIQGFYASWTGPSSSFTDYSYTALYYSTNPAFTASTVAPAWKGTGTYAEFSQITTYVPYYLKTIHFDVFGQSSPESSSVSVTPLNPDSSDTTPPGTASIVSANFVGTTASVIFNGPKDADLANFRIDLSSPGSAASPSVFQVAASAVGGGDQNFILTIDNNSSYFGAAQSTVNGKIYSRDRVGNTSSSFASFSAVSSLTAPSVTYNNAQWGTSASGLDAGVLSYTVSWDNVSACAGYGYSKVSASTAGNPWSTVYQGANNSVTISSGLSNQTWVYVQHYTVFNTAGSSAVPKSVTPTNPVVVNTTAPSNATNLTVTASNDGGATGFSGHLVASWTQSTASNIRGYRLRVRQADEPYYEYENAASNVTQYHIGGLVPGENYEVAIAAYDELNNTSSYTLANSYAIIPYAASFAETFTISAASNSTNIAITGTTAASMVGMTIYGYGIVGGTIVTGSATGSLTLSQPTFATISGSAASLTYGVSNLTSYIVAGTSSYMKFGTGVKGTQSGLFIDDNNYWFNSGNFRVGTGSTYVSWDGTALRTSGDIIAKSGSFDGNILINSNGTIIAGALPTVSGARVVMNSLGISASNTSNVNTFTLSSTTGFIGASAGVIGGWTLSPTNLSSNNINIDSTGSATFGAVGTGSIVALSSTDPTYRLWIGSLTPSGAAFRVDKGGTVYANSASIVGDITATNGYFVGDITANTLSLTGNELIYGSIIAASAARITGATRTAAGSIVFALNVANPFAVGASVSIGGAARNIDGLYTASVDSSGSLVVFNAGTAGTVTTGSNAFAASYNSGPRTTMSSSGLYVYNSSNEQIVTLPTNTGAQAQIAGWFLNSGSLTKGSGATRVALSSGSAAGDIVFWAGNDTRTAAPVRITNTGNASFANIWAASTGTVAGWSITSSALFYSQGSTNPVIPTSVSNSSSTTVIGAKDTVIIDSAATSGQPQIYLQNYVTDQNWQTTKLNATDGTFEIYRKFSNALGSPSLTWIKYDQSSQTASVLLSGTDVTQYSTGQVFTLTGLTSSSYTITASSTLIHRAAGTASVNGTSASIQITGTASNIYAGNFFTASPVTFYNASVVSVTLQKDFDPSGSVVTASYYLLSLSQSAGGPTTTGSLAFYERNKFDVISNSSSLTIGDYINISSSAALPSGTTKQLVVSSSIIGTSSYISFQYGSSSILNGPITASLTNNPDFSLWNNTKYQITSYNSTASVITFPVSYLDSSLLLIYSGSLSSTGSFSASQQFGGKITTQPFSGQDGMSLMFTHDLDSTGSGGWPSRLDGYTGTLVNRIIQPMILTRATAGTIELNGSWMSDGISKVYLGDGYNNVGAGLYTNWDLYLAGGPGTITSAGRFTKTSSFWTSSALKDGRVGITINSGQGPNTSTSTVNTGSIAGISGTKYLVIARSSSTTFAVGQEFINTENSSASPLGTLNQVTAVTNDATTGNASVFFTYALNSAVAAATPVTVYNPDRRKFEVNSTGNILIQSDENVYIQANRYFSTITAKIELLRNNDGISQINLFADKIKYGTGYFESGITIEKQSGWYTSSSPLIRITPFTTDGTTNSNRFEFWSTDSSDATVANEWRTNGFLRSTSKVVAGASAGANIVSLSSATPRAILDGVSGRIWATASQGAPAWLDRRDGTALATDQNIVNLYYNGIAVGQLGLSTSSTLFLKSGAAAANGVSIPGLIGWSGSVSATASATAGFSEFLVAASTSLTGVVVTSNAAGTARTFTANVNKRASGAASLGWVQLYVENNAGVALGVNPTIFYMAW